MSDYVKIKSQTGKKIKEKPSQRLKLYKDCKRLRKGHDSGAATQGKKVPDFKAKI